MINILDVRSITTTPSMGEIPSRIPVDKVSNQLGKELIETMGLLGLGLG